MLKPLLLSGWFRVQPFLKYVVVVLVIAPLVVASGHSSSAKQSQAARINSVTAAESDPLSMSASGVNKPDLAQVLKAAQLGFLIGASDSMSMSTVAVNEPQLLQSGKVESWTVEDNRVSMSIIAKDSLGAVEFAPLPKNSDSHSTGMTASESELIQRLKKGYKDAKEAKSLLAAKISPSLRQVQPNTQAPAKEPSEAEQAAPNDPIGSPYPIPWQWIQQTQQAIGSKGGSGVRYYRSIPVLSPDGRYAVYSRVQLEVKPEMYNSRVTSTMFVEDRQTGKLRVMTATGPISDPLLKVRASVALNPDTNGTIGVLVPVSWSQQGDRFLARKFEGVLNTADATDHAVIWDRQKNNTNSVTPSQEQKEHDIAVLLGWSKTQPNNVLFRAGEMGEENWPVVSVSSDGKTANAPDVDQPIIYGQKISDVWSRPEVASR
ncbi:MAG: hypothetical protein KME60_09110 [Cyanomargarita calcarea GSE-NOS-MK-12-04C]|jgi:hypothetical protein|uniref:Uncharacterized protein n=1 Tax=Cyanomargarita calcarea GSE-NOS-MK-12-04C TaxID=2839659 RepID=A0A951UU99_9CYAN|nr:hypothetical protein [Cyanomargarita calcarea GSE-NOS-MK-12-04C]